MKESSSASKVLKERMFTRVPVQSPAKILIDGETIEGLVETISINGVFVASDRPIALNSLVTITIFDSGQLHTLMESKAKVVSVTSNGFGLQFESSS